MGHWVQSLGEQIGTQLGQIIAESVHHTLAGAIDVRDIARRLGAETLNGRRGRKASGGARSVCKEPDCDNPVLAKGLCRSHYYRARYRAQKASLVPRGRGRRRRSGQTAAAAT
jgi:hypothetical protein